MHDNHRAAVAGFYETHPINEDEILQKLSARGLNLQRLTEQELKEFDQDHYGGVEAVEALAGQRGSLEASTCWTWAAAWAAPRAGSRTSSAVV